MFSLKEVVGDRPPELTIVDVGAMIEGENRYDISSTPGPEIGGGFNTASRHAPKDAVMSPLPAAKHQHVLILMQQGSQVSSAQSSASMPK